MDDTRKVRTVVAVVLLVAGCVLAPAAVAGAWARTQVTNTDRYVENVVPLAADPRVRNAVADRITDVILRNLPERIANGARGVVRGQVGQLIESETFQTLWRNSNRTAHQQLVNALSGRNGPLGVNGNTVSIDLGPFVAAARDRLVAAGFSSAARIPDVHQSFDLFSSPDLYRAQRGYRLLDRYGVVLPIVAGALLVLGLGLVVDRRRALMGAGIGVAVSMVVLGILLAIGRQHYLDRLPAELSRATGAAAFDIVTRSLRTALVVIFLIGLVAAGAALVAGLVIRRRSGRTAGPAGPPEY
ncbi:hypothetical protein [Kribbella sp.]|uniref:hypothetical protein n=1 Tax=Kribbella sp. TaxID=1871183 RepID=UPI002D57B842|nr:hypothetical protein [Kribbella sp.]HZX04426.1 hypothetical protein [Kribbella sp.]